METREESLKIRVMLLLIIVVVGTMVIGGLKYSRSVNPDSNAFGHRHGDISRMATVFAMLAGIIVLSFLGDLIGTLDRWRDRIRGWPRAVGLFFYETYGGADHFWKWAIALVCILIFFLLIILMPGCKRSVQYGNKPVPGFETKNWETNTFLAEVQNVIVHSQEVSVMSEVSILPTHEGGPIGFITVMGSPFSRTSFAGSNTAIPSLVNTIKLMLLKRNFEEVKPILVEGYSEWRRM